MRNDSGFSDQAFGKVLRSQVLWNLQDDGPASLNRKEREIRRRGEDFQVLTDARENLPLNPFPAREPLRQCMLGRRIHGKKRIGDHLKPRKRFVA